IIPNSQLYVIPYPPSEPSEWLLKLYVTPSRSITLTGLALAGTCGLVALIIGILHWRDRRADYRERREESHRFHFDAM
ncbi:Tcell immunomodulatory proteinlike, partial [Caligus rogercresseyi]